MGTLLRVIHKMVLELGVVHMLGGGAVAPFTVLTGLDELVSCAIKSSGFTDTPSLTRIISPRVGRSVRNVAPTGANGCQT